MITERQIQLIIGCLLHDIGKVVYRSGDGRNHSKSGYDYLKTEANISNTDILDCVRYHHAKYLRNASIENNALAYIAYYADNIAAFSDRREAIDAENGFDNTKPLDSIFNILNGKHGKSHYAMRVLNPQEGINYPTTEPIKMDAHFYQTVVQNLTDNLHGITFEPEYVNSLLSIMEANLSYIPSSTSNRELTDISLYDHVKITAAVASCVEQWLSEQGEMDYRTKLFCNAEDSYNDEMFLLYSMDISGIQNFIYTIGEKGALKGLRARSFYLEILMENIVDDLLDKLSLSRANLMYSGGGHCYMLFPNTDFVKRTLEEYDKELNEWILQYFDTALYVATGYAVANANMLRNVPKGSYSELYREISKTISNKKMHRYNAEDIIRLNHREHKGERECSVCRRISKLQNEKCSICNALENMARDVITHHFFTVLDYDEHGSLPLPGQKHLVADNEKEVIAHMQQDGYIRCYTKNGIYTGKHVTTKLWVGDYRAKDTFMELAEASVGIKRLAVLRADVDNLGTTFVSGFQGADGDERYETLSRTATLSRQLSLFFKGYINKILQEGGESPFARKGPRNIVIVYSGGDDVFLAGAWNDVIAAFVDLKDALTRFTQGALTISGGIGLYHDKFPINVMAQEVEYLEEVSKDLDDKNAITLFSNEHCYLWPAFQNKVIEEKYALVSGYFDSTQQHGMAFLYHLVELLRGTQEQINIARYVYLLSRMEPGKEAAKLQREDYRRFSEKMYEWSRSEEDRRELITAIYLYVYLHRSDLTQGEEEET